MIDSLRYKIQKIQQQVGINSKQRFSDPLDIYEGVKQSFQKGAEFIYNQFENQDSEKVKEGLGALLKLCSDLLKISRAEIYGTGCSVWL